MRTLPAVLLLALLLPAVRAQEGDAATVQIPKGTPVSFKVASFDRIDAVVKEWVPMLKAMGLGNEVAPLEQMPASALLFTLSGLNAEIVDTTKPIYVGLSEQHEPIFILHPAAGAAFEGKKELREGASAVMRGGAIVVAGPGLLDTEARGTPTTFRVEGDAVVHVYLADIIAKHKEDIEQGATELAMGVAAQGDVPEEARALILPLITAFKDGVMSLESLDYGATWTGGRLETEGFVAIREGSGLRNLLKRSGAPGSADLAAYLPKEAFMTMSVCTNADWPAKEMKALFEAAGGGDLATAILQLMSLGSAFDEARTGRAATAVSMSFMSAGATSLMELKPGTDTKALLASLDFTKSNAALAKVGIPLSYTVEKGVAKHGEIELHRFAMSSDDPQLAMAFSGMPGYLAAHKDILFVAMSPTAEDDLKALLDKVTRDEKDAEHPHLAAMARLGRGHNMGFTINIGAIKPFLGMAQMFGMPAELGQAMQAIPDVFTLSTAVTFPEGNIRWRGDWPVKEAMKIAEATMGAKGAAEAPPPTPEDEPVEPEGEKFD